MSLKILFGMSHEQFLYMKTFTVKNFMQFDVFLFVLNLHPLFQVHVLYIMDKMHLIANLQHQIYAFCNIKY